MVARFSGAGLGLLAFTVTVVAGLSVGNPVEVTLSRSILALFTFCILGFVIGGVAQLVISEHERTCVSEIEDRYSQDDSGPSDDGAEAKAADVEAAVVAEEA